MQLPPPRREKASKLKQSITKQPQLLARVFLIPQCYFCQEGALQHCGKGLLLLFSTHIPYPLRLLFAILAHESDGLTLHPKRQVQSRWAQAFSCERHTCGLLRERERVKKTARTQMKSETFSTSVISRSTTATSARVTTDHTTIPTLMTNTDAKMQLAIAAVATSGMSVREAARRHGVPRTTLQRKLSKDPHAATTTTTRSNSVTSPSGAGSDTSSSPSSSSTSFAGNATTPANGRPTVTNVSAPTHVATLGSILDVTQNTIGSFLNLSSVNGPSTTTTASTTTTTSTPSRKRSAEAMSSLEEQQPIGKGAYVCLFLPWCFFSSHVGMRAHALVGVVDRM